MIKKSSFIVFGLILFIISTGIYILASDVIANEECCSVSSGLIFDSIDGLFDSAGEFEAFISDNLDFSYSSLLFSSIDELKTYIYNDENSYIQNILKADSRIISETDSGNSTKLFYPDFESSDFVLDEIVIHGAYISYLFAKPSYLDDISKRAPELDAFYSTNQNSLIDEDFDLSNRSNEELIANPPRRGGMLPSFAEELITDELNSTIAFEWTLKDNGEELLYHAIEMFDLRELPGKPGYYYEILGLEETGVDVNLYQIRWLEDGYSFFLRVPVEYFERNPYILGITSLDLNI